MFEGESFATAALARYGLGDSYCFPILKGFLHDSLHHRIPSRFPLGFIIVKDFFRASVCFSVPHISLGFPYDTEFLKGFSRSSLVYDWSHWLLFSSGEYKHKGILILWCFLRGFSGALLHYKIL